jgi:hypothetical protein
MSIGLRSSFLKFDGRKSPDGESDDAALVSDLTGTSKRHEALRKAASWKHLLFQAFYGWLATPLALLHNLIFLVGAWLRCPDCRRSFLDTIEVAKASRLPTHYFPRIFAAAKPILGYDECRETVATNLMERDSQLWSTFAERLS